MTKRPPEATTVQAASNELAKITRASASDLDDVIAKIVTLVNEQGTIKTIDVIDAALEIIDEDHDA